MTHEAAVEVRQLRAAFRACPTVMFITTARAAIVDATDAAVDFLNVPRHVLEGKPLLYFVARGDTRRFRAYVSGGACEPARFKLRARGGPVREVRVVVRSEAGRLIWVAHVEPVAPIVDTSASTSAPSVTPAPAGAPA